MERAERVRRIPRGNGGVLLGLCAGFGAHLGLDPLVLRFGLLLLMLLAPAGLAVPVLYLIFALFVPVEE